jgi:hypothetical protein
MTRFASALLVLSLTAMPVHAEVPGGPTRCGLFCKIWRNVSGRVQSPIETTAWDDGSMRSPTIAEEARVPRTSDLVVVHGDLIRKSSAERAHEKAQMAAELSRIDALRQDQPGDKDTGAVRPRAKLGQAD